MRPGLRRDAAVVHRHTAVHAPSRFDPERPYASPENEQSRDAATARRNLHQKGENTCNA